MSVPAHRYSLYLYPGKLRVDVVFGGSSSPEEHYPHVVTYRRRGEPGAEVLFPSPPYYLSTVVHEGVHLLGWAEEHLTEEELGSLVPAKDMAWAAGDDAVREEARCRLMDRWVLRFLDEVNAGHIEYSRGRRFDKPLVPTLDIPD